jgi:succinylarginine dihydrolase (EC 3.-.-.-)
MKSYEVNFDGLVGPTHNYGGLSYGNVASQSNSQQGSNPREAARQGLAKMKALADMGFKQGVLAPQERPDVAALRRLGFSGSDAEVIQRAAKEAMPLLVASCSASSMWVANAATVSPSADTADGRVHFTAANLNCKYHRSIEHPTTSRCWVPCSTTTSTLPTTRHCLPWRSSVTRGRPTTRASAVHMARPAWSSSSTAAAPSTVATRRRRSTRPGKPWRLPRLWPGCMA